MWRGNASVMRVATRVGASDARWYGVGVRMCVVESGVIIGAIARSMISSGGVLFWRKQISAAALFS